MKKKDTVQEKTAALHEQKELLNATIESTADGILAVDNEGNVIHANSRFAGMWRIPEQVFRTKNDKKLLDYVLDQLQTPQAFLNKVKKLYGSSKESFDTIRFTDGRIFERYSRPLIKNGEIAGRVWSFRDITARRKIEDNLAKESYVNIILAEISKTLIQEKSLEQISSLVLQQAKELTRSPVGLVSYIDPATGRLVCPTMTEDIRRQCKIINPQPDFHKFQGLWSWVLEERKPLMTNDPAGDPRSKGLPAGHLPVKRFLSVPAMMGRTLVGQITLANAETDYTARDLSMLESIANLYALALRRTLAENILKEKEKKHRTLLHNLQVGVVVHAADTRILINNPKASELLGITQDQLLDKTVIDLPWRFYREDGTIMPFAEYPVNQVTARRGPIKDLVIGVRRPDKKDLVWVMCWAYPVFDERNNLYQIVTHFIDITARKKAEEARRISEERMMLVTRATNDAIWDSDLANGTVWWNAAYEKLFGPRPPDNRTNWQWWTEHIHPEDRERVVTSVRAAVAGKADHWTAEYRYQRTDGSYAHVLDRAFIARNPSSGKAHRILGAILDLTARKEMEKKLKDSHAQLEQRVAERTSKLVKASLKMEREILERKQTEEALRQSRSELAKQKESLEETNTALKVLLKKRELDRHEIEEQVVANIKGLVEPFVEKLKKSGLTDRQKNYLQILESNLNDIAAPFVRSVSSKFLGLTPSEIQVANLVKQGKSTKEIAAMMNLSACTINVHRRNIRKKLGISCKKKNLQTFLVSQEASSSDYF